MMLNGGKRILNKLNVQENISSHYNNRCIPMQAIQHNLLTQAGNTTVTTVKNHAWQLQEDNKIKV